MGFKRTAEGRVFFENSYENENAAGNAGGSSLEIAGLLRALNQRLQDAQAERTRLMRELNDFRDVIQELEDRTSRGEQAYMDLEQKVALKQDESLTKAERAERAAKETLNDILEARNSLSELLDKSEDGERIISAVRQQIDENRNLVVEMRKRQAILEKLQKEQGEKMVDHVAAYVAISKRINAAEARYITLDNKIEETANRQAQLDRRFEKANQDRARFLRKIDRIEETVIQMRDTLNAKAMVVLADPNAAAAQLPPAQNAVKEENLRAREPVVLKRKPAEEEGLPWWQKSFQFQASAITLATALFIVAGLAVLVEVTPSLKEKFVAGDFAVLDESKWRQVGTGIVQSELVEPGKPLVVDVQEELQSRSRAAPPQPEPQPQEESFSEAGLANDIGAIDLNNEEQLLAALEENPDALAARLNEIEPGSEPGSEPEVTEEAAPVKAEEPQAGTQVAAADAAARTAEKEASAAPVSLTETQEEPVAADQGRSTLAERIQPDPNLPKAVREVEVQAFSGIAEAQHDLAAIYVAGHGGVEKNFERAAQWFREAAENGIANASYNLGVLYHQGLGVPRSIEEAIEWYTAAAEQNHPEAQYNLGIAYIEGIGVPYDPFKASRYFENAARAGITEASYNLGLIYENGLLGQAQPDQALVWYKAAADKGSPEAKAALEQLAKTLGVDIEEVNKLADRVKQSKAEPPPALQRQPVQKTASAVRQPAQQPPQPAPIAQLAPEDVRVLSTHEQTRILTAKIQDHLIRLGLYPGPADGMGGPLTADAIRSYQALSKLEVNGRPSAQLLEHMQAQLAGDLEFGSREE